MQALIGRITKRTIKQTASGSTNIEISFKAVCVLPQRTKPPEWLTDQTLTVERSVADPREIGMGGENIVLAARESLKWLEPLRVSPSVTYGAPPARLDLTLDWWKDEKAPEFTVTAAGRTVSGTFEKTDAGFTGPVDLRELLESPPSRPFTIEITCDKLKAACTCLPAGETAFGFIPPAEQGRRYRIDSRWYGVDIAPDLQAGMIIALREKGRGCDHFGVTSELIRTSDDQGQIDRMRLGWGWSDKPREAVATCTGGRRDGHATRFAVDSLLDDGQGLRSSVVYTSYDDYPIVTVQREFQFHKPKDKKDENGKPKEQIDDVQTTSVGFRTATVAERGPNTGSRILTSDGGRLVVYRSPLIGDSLGNTDWLADAQWRTRGGWVLIEHPERRQHILYCFDRDQPPKIAANFWNTIVNLVLEWLLRAVRPEESFGFSAAIAAGELRGARGNEAWVALRVPASGGGLHTAVVGRLSDGKEQVAEVSVGGESKTVPMEHVLLPGIGHVSFAAARFASGNMECAFDASVDGIPSRGENR